MATPTTYYQVIQVNYHPKSNDTHFIRGLYESIELIEKDYRVGFSKMERYKQMSIRQIELTVNKIDHYWIRETKLIQDTSIRQCAESKAYLFESNPYNIKSLEQFKSSQINIDKSDSDIYKDDETVISVCQFDGYCEIGEQQNDSFHLCLDRSEYHGGFTQLVELLWDWYKWELRLTEQEVEDDLQIRASQLLKRLNLSYSLDEIPEYNLSVMSGEDRIEVDYLIDQFNKPRIES